MSTFGYNFRSRIDGLVLFIVEYDRGIVNSLKVLYSKKGRSGDHIVLFTEDNMEYEFKQHNGVVLTQIWPRRNHFDFLDDNVKNDLKDQPFYNSLQKRIEQILDYYKDHPSSELKF